MRVAHVCWESEAGLCIDRLGFALLLQTRHFLGEIYSLDHRRTNVHLTAVFLMVWLPET